MSARGTCSVATKESSHSSHFARSIRSVRIFSAAFDATTERARQLECTQMARLKDPRMPGEISLTPLSGGILEGAMPVGGSSPKTAMRRQR